MRQLVMMWKKNFFKYGPKENSQKILDKSLKEKLK